jgi:phytoene dehydrogenase-like protein
MCPLSSTSPQYEVGGQPVVRQLAIPPVPPAPLAVPPAPAAPVPPPLVPAVEVLPPVPAVEVPPPPPVPAVEVLPPVPAVEVLPPVPAVEVLPAVPAVGAAPPLPEGGAELSVEVQPTASHAHAKASNDAVNATVLKLRIFGLGGKLQTARRLTRVFPQRRAGRRAQRRVPVDSRDPRGDGSPVNDPDVVVIGAGPNGLSAAATLARRGYRVLVVEANPRRAGGAVGSEALTLPGFRHDVGAGFFPFGSTSPAFRSLDLPGAGLVWRHAKYQSCHPALDGSFACIARGPALETAPFGSPRDADAFRALARFHAGIEPTLLAALLEPFPSLRPLLGLGLRALVRLAGLFARSGRALASKLFETEAARRVLPGLGLHVDVGPDDAFGAPLGYMLGLTATTGGYAVPAGGAQSLTDALIARLTEAGGAVRLGARVARVVVRGRRASAIVLDDGTEIPAGRAILADTSAAALLLRMLEARDVPSWLRAFMRRFPQGWGTFKMDWALSAPVPWRVEAARESAVVHAGESLDDLSRFTREVRDGRLPERPYLVVGQQSLADPTRAPAGRHTLYCYSHVPSRVVAASDGWGEARERFADRIEARIEELAPGFRATILGRHVAAPPDLEAWDANLVGGDLGGGSNAWHRQLLFRPVFPYFRYRMPVAGLYLCSSYTHPGAGVHGMCGMNAALVAARDLERTRPA